MSLLDKFKRPETPSRMLLAGGDGRAIGTLFVGSHSYSADRVTVVLRPPTHQGESWEERVMDYVLPNGQCVYGPRGIQAHTPSRVSITFMPQY